MSIMMRNRVAISGPENDLVNSFLQNIPLFESDDSPVMFREPSLPTGYPDLVFVYPNRRNYEVNFEHRNELNSEHVRMLSHLYMSQEQDLEQVAKALNMEVRKTKRIVDCLVLAGFAHRLENFIKLEPVEDVFIASQIVAIEAKMRDWKSAIKQAVANTWFASQSYILLPKLRVIDKVCEEAARMGVGVIVHDGGKTEVILCPQKVQMPGSYGSWIVNEWAAKELRIEHV